MTAEALKFNTYAHLPEIQAACLRVLVLDDSKSGIDKLEPWVRFRIEDAAKTLDECHELIAALETYVDAIQKADCKAFKKLAQRYAEKEPTDGR